MCVVYCTITALLCPTQQGHAVAAPAPSLSGVRRCARTSQGTTPHVSGVSSPLTTPTGPSCASSPAAPALTLQELAAPAGARCMHLHLCIPAAHGEPDSMLINSSGSRRLLLP